MGFGGCVGEIAGIRREGAVVDNEVRWKDGSDAKDGQ